MSKGACQVTGQIKDWVQVSCRETKYGRDVAADRFAARRRLRRRKRFTGDPTDTEGQ